MDFPQMNGKGIIVEGIANTPTEGNVSEQFIGINFGDVPVYFALGDDEFARANRKGLAELSSLYQQYAPQVQSMGVTVTFDIQRRWDAMWRAGVPCGQGLHWLAIGDPVPLVTYTQEGNDLAKVVLGVPGVVIGNYPIQGNRPQQFVYVRFPGGVRDWSLNSNWNFIESDLDLLAKQGREIITHYPEYLAKARQYAAQP